MAFRTLSKRLAPLALVVLVGAGMSLVRARSATAQEAPDDGVPRGALAYFATGTACPMGWAPATTVQGRFVVGVTESAGVGRTVGNALMDRENRAHTHTFNTTVNLPARAIAAGDGSNNQGARSGMYTVMGTTTAASSGLGFVQLRACVKQ
ncbi:MAG: hypothetical protein JNK05_23895 [Myxococcales bacterium]|nr:hypothetical protein [Myxococcales bacterium]